MVNESLEHEKAERDQFECPIGHFFGCLKKGLGPRSQFRKHLYRSQVEFLRAIRSLIDERIEDLEKRAEAPQKKAIKVEVE